MRATRRGLTRALAVLALGAMLVAATPTAASDEPGRIEGRVTLAVEGVRIADLGPLVVYVQPERSEEDPSGKARRPEIRQRNARFTPSFMAISEGQVVEMPNDDDIDHNVYSASGENRFDLGIYASGESRSVRFDHAGQVDIHCSIHESMNATVFVSPSPWYARVGSDGRFAIGDLPPGRYRLRTWSERLPRAEMFLRVRPGTTLETTVVIGAPADGE